MLQVPVDILTAIIVFSWEQVTSSIVLKVLCFTTSATLLHEIKALQQITYPKLTRTFINVIQAKNGPLLALHLINVNLINVITKKKR